MLERKTSKEASKAPRKRPRKAARKILLERGLKSLERDLSKPAHKPAGKSLKAQLRPPITLLFSHLFTLAHNPQLPSTLKHQIIHLLYLYHNPKLQNLIKTSSSLRSVWIADCNPFPPIPSYSLLFPRIPSQSILIPSTMSYSKNKTQSTLFSFVSRPSSSHSSKISEVKTTQSKDELDHGTENDEPKRNESTSELRANLDPTLNKKTTKKKKR